ncbi:MAG TPA: DUF5076 domain-containing protein [Gemmataceae bacterium]|nr:DUF5076 domain-containing protein [Gemmataceae bacterium]
MRELPVPPDATTARRADEVVRGWIIDNRLQCSLLPSFWADSPSTWGTLLADAMHHVCDALADETGRDRAEIAGLVLRAFRSEVEHPTGNPRGRHISWDA